MAQTYGRSPQCNDLGVRGRISGLLANVVAATDDLARGRHDDGTNRNLIVVACRACLG